MKILGIETSCDETAVCVIEADGDLAHSNVRFSILGNALYSQVETHRPYGGVFPNLARREHERNLVPMLTKLCGVKVVVHGDGLLPHMARAMTLPGCAEYNSIPAGGLKVKDGEPAWRIVMREMLFDIRTLVATI